MSILYNFICKKHILSIIEDVKDKKSTSINLSSLDIEVLPKQLFECKCLERLYLHVNNLKQLESNIINLPHITTLTLDYNALSDLPSEITFLVNLQNLNISHNPLKKIPQVCELKKLEVLWCNSIDMENLPENIGSLKELDTFGARGNKIRQLPHSFTQLSKLSWLTLENNLLNKLPSDIHKMKSLVHLNLKNNELKSLPHSLCRCKNMQYIFIRSNQISLMNLHNVLNISSMKHLIYIDARDNPFTQCSNIKDKLLKYPKMKVDDEWTSPSEVDNTEQIPETDLPLEYEIEAEVTPVEPDDTDISCEPELEVEDSSSVGSDDDWENSYPSSQLDSTDHDDDGIENNEVIGLYLPELSRFIGTGS